MVPIRGIKISKANQPLLFKSCKRLIQIIIMEAINAIHSKTASKIEMMVSGWLKEFVGSCTAEIVNPVSPRENKIVKIHEKLIAKIKFQARNDKRVKRPLGERGLSEDELFID